MFHISTDIPDGCQVDQAVYVVRHGSRYPDPGAYVEWTTLYSKVLPNSAIDMQNMLILSQIQNATFTASGALDFLPTWKPVLQYPDQEIAMVSPGGWKEL